jgi:hypothetical protein
MKCLRVLGSLDGHETCCGGVWLLKIEISRRPEFLVDSRNDLEQEFDFWAKFELNGI